MSSTIARSIGRSANIFVNYRRDDTAGHTGRLFDRLSSRFPGRIFRDIDTIEPGIDFVEIIHQAVGCCEVLIVMIGREWLNITDATGRRRLDNTNDFVRLEIATALERDIRIIPVLVEGAAMPRPEDLPPELALLSRRNAIELSDGRWAFDVDRLIQAIEGVLQDKAPSALMPVTQLPETPAPVPQTPPPPAPERRVSQAWVAALLFVLALALWIGWRLERPGAAPQQAGEEAPVIDTKPLEPAPSAIERKPEANHERQITRQPAGKPAEKTTDSKKTWKEKKQRWGKRVRGWFSKDN